MNKFSNQQKNTQSRTPMKSFLPTNYESPKGNSAYFKPEDGENKIRILSAPILGWLDWTEDKRPLRFRYDNKPNPIVADKPVKHFWTMIIWSYDKKQIMIYEATQSGVRAGLEALSKDADWGIPTGYDVKIVRTGKDQKTKYTVNPLPHRPVDEHIKAQFADKPINLEALFDGADPFSQGWDSYTAMFSEEPIEAPKAAQSSGAVIDAAQRDFLMRLIADDDDSDEALKLVLSACKCARIEDFRKDKYDAAISWMKKRRAEQEANVDEAPF